MFARLPTEPALADERRTQDIDVVPLTFVAGQGFDRERGTVGKLRLASRLQALLATDPQRIELPRLHPQMPTLLAEIDAYRLKLQADTGHETIGGVGGEHDDEITALLLSIVDDPATYLTRSIRFHAPGYY